MKVRISKIELCHKTPLYLALLEDYPDLITLEAEPLTGTERCCEKCRGTFKDVEEAIRFAQPCCSTPICPCHRKEEKHQYCNDVTSCGCKTRGVPPKAEEITRCTTDNPCLIFSKMAPPLKEIKELETKVGDLFLVRKINELVRALNELRK